MLIFYYVDRNGNKIGCFNEHKIRAIAARIGAKVYQHTISEHGNSPILGDEWNG